MDWFKKMKTFRILLFVLLSVITLVSIHFGMWYFRIYDLKKQGEEIVDKVEEYRSNYGHLPVNMASFGMEEGDGVDTPFYVKVDSKNYFVAFGVGFDEMLTFYSDSQEWENGYRKMK